jgi:hypothetical protein
VRRCSRRSRNPLSSPLKPPPPPPIQTSSDSQFPESEPLNDPTPEGPPSPIDPNSVILSPLEDLHYKLEIIEGRIRDGTDIQNFHPALSITVLNGYDFTKLEVYEKNAKMHYAVREEPQVIPNNWEQRVWDRPNTRLSEEETAELQKRLSGLQAKSGVRRRRNFSRKRKKIIEESTSGESDDEEFIEESDDAVVEQPLRRIKSRIRTRLAGIHQNKKPAIFRWSTRKFTTDDDADDTDFSEF